MSALLSVDGVSKRFRGLVAVDRVSFEVPAGGIFAVIGPNGAGKTTLFNMIAGVFPPDSGSIDFAGERIDGLTPDRICRRGIGRTFQINALFRKLSVLDNVALGIAERRRIGLRMWRPAHAYRELRDECLALLDTLGLADDAGRRVLDLPYGKQRLVEIAIALGLRPSVLLLDEPAAGVPSMESGRILEVLDRLPREISILIIEHDMDLVFRFAQRITVLVQGEVLLEGTPDEIARDRRVQQVYLGEQRHG